MRIYSYINNQGGQVKLMAIEGPPAASESPLDMFEKTLEHEEFITEGIDGSTAKTLQWVAAGFSLRKETGYVSYLRNLKVVAT